MRKNDSIKTIKIIQENLYMTIATSSIDAHPWISNLFYCYDKDLNFYWYSSKTSKHSQNINSNPYIAISIFNSTAVGDDVDAFYATAKVQEINQWSELFHALTLYSRKLFSTGFIKSIEERKAQLKNIKDFLGKSKLKMYKATPISIWKLGPSKTINGKYIDSRIQISLSDLQYYI